jgi:phosphate starvation-inducible membrane PsiE
MKDTLIHSVKYFQDYILFLIVVLAGIFTKIWLAIQKGKKPNLSWLLAEAIVSFFVAFSVYAICDQYFNLNKMFTCVLCAWGGVKSTLIQSKVEKLISSFFDNLIKSN